MTSNLEASQLAKGQLEPTAGGEYPDRQGKLVLTLKYVSR
jgi:hypothetical protein